MNPYDLKTTSFELKNLKALVTGATSGIGQAMAVRLASEGVHLNLVARRIDRLSDLKKYCEDHYKVKVRLVEGDLTQEETIQKMKSHDFFQSNILINNAGAAFGRDEVKDLKVVDMTSMIELNVISAFRLIREILPSMIAAGQGDIISLGSVAGLEPYAGGATYCASKAALKAFHEALRHEIYGQNIRVMMMSPGMVETEFALVRWKNDAEKARATYQGMTPLTAQDVARQMVIMLQNPRHAAIDDLVFLSTDQGGAALVKRK
ncbi:MAG: SDR family NAD(P)-dependent oxidoreductase [Bacteriovoracaceae bacterium]